MHALLLVGLLASIDAASAAQAFTELRDMCRADSGRLWGREICGPVVLADPRTREAMTEDGPAAIPESIGIANTAVEWEGKRWTMVMWPLPESLIARRALLAHESFHRIQSEIGFPPSGPANAHLDEAAARYWMRLEWRALARALATDDSQAVADALAFRQKRRELYPAGADEERMLEMHEGIAEHTGFALAVPHRRERVAPLVRRLASSDRAEQFARSFAYASGPAWGALLDAKRPGWTRRLSASDDLGDLARRAWNLPAQLSLHPERYDGDAVLADENARADRKRQLFADLQARFIDGPVLILPLQQMQFTFDPNRVQPFGHHGTVYASTEVRDAWGSIKSSDGGLISPDFRRLVVPLREGAYELKLNDGWTLIDGERPGDRMIAPR